MKTLRKVLLLFIILTSIVYVFGGSYHPKRSNSANSILTIAETTDYIPTPNKSKG